MSRLPETEEADYRACMVGFRDYVNKNGFRNVVLGLSGGIDSAICAAIAVDALGEERVRTVMMPYRYTAKDSIRDAEDCARLLGCHYDVVPIEEPVAGFTSALSTCSRAPKAASPRKPAKPGARHHSHGHLQQVRLDGGDDGQQERMSVGYCTLYGDMNGGFNPIKDLYKMQVYALSAWRNANCRPARWDPTAWSSRRTSSTRRPRPNSGPTRPTRIPCRPIRCLTIFSNAWWKRKWGPRRSSPAAMTWPRPSRRASALCRRIQAPAVGARRQDHPQEFRPRPALSHHQPFPRPGLTAMQWRNSRRAWGIISVALHWLTAGLFVFQVWLGITMVVEPDLIAKFYDYHCTNPLASPFSALRWSGSPGFFDRPSGPAGSDARGRNAGSPSSPIWHSTLAAGHPATGWALVSASPLMIPTVCFGQVVIPHLPVRGVDPCRADLSSIHANPRYLAIGLVGRIVCSAQHHFHHRDPTAQAHAQAG